MVVLDATLLGSDESEMAHRLRAARQSVQVLIFAERGEPTSVRRLLATGAAGYVLKRADGAEVVRAIRAVANGDTYLDPTIVNGAGSEAELSAREYEVLRRIALGYSNKEIAARLNVSVKTVETYKTRAMEKLQFRGRVELVRHAVRRGWLTDAGDALRAPEALATSGVVEPTS